MSQSWPLGIEKVHWSHRQSRSGIAPAAMGSATVAASSTGLGQTSSSLPPAVLTDARTRGSLEQSEPGGRCTDLAPMPHLQFAQDCRDVVVDGLL